MLCVMCYVRGNASCHRVLITSNTPLNVVLVLGSLVLLAIFLFANFAFSTNRHTRTLSDASLPGSRRTATYARRFGVPCCAMA